MKLSYNHNTLTKKYTNILLTCISPQRHQKKVHNTSDKHFNGAIKCPYHTTLIQAEIRHYIYISVTKKAVTLLYGSVNASSPLRLHSENQCKLASYYINLFCCMCEMYCVIYFYTSNKKLSSDVNDYE